MFAVHLFFCQRVRTQGQSCGGSALFDGLGFIKRRIKELGLSHWRANMTTCLGQCKQGPVLVVYPHNLWYRYEVQADLEQILESLINKNDPPTHLQLAGPTVCN